MTVPTLRLNDGHTIPQVGLVEHPVDRCVHVPAPLEPREQAEDGGGKRRGIAAAGGVRARKGRGDG